MADKESEILETEHDRHVKYRKFREAGKSDAQAREEVWPSTSGGVKKNADDKARADTEKAEKKAAASEGK